MIFKNVLITPFQYNWFPLQSCMFVLFKNIFQRKMLGFIRCHRGPWPRRGAEPLQRAGRGLRQSWALLMTPPLANAVGPWANHSPSLGLSVLICQMEPVSAGLNACWKEPGRPPRGYQEVPCFPLAHQTLRPAGLGMQGDLGWLAFESQFCHLLAMFLGSVVNLSVPSFLSSITQRK